MGNTFFTDDWAVVGIIDPDAYAASTYLTAAIDMQDWERVAFVVMAGTLGTSATVDFDVTASTTSGGTYATLAKNITQLTEAGTDSDKQVVVEVSGAEVITAGKRFIKGSLVIATATSDAGVIALGRPRNFAPARDGDLASVDEIVTA
jgi:hypothetical protein